MKSFLQYLKTRPLALISVILLLLMYFVMVTAEFIAPYTPVKSYEKNTFHPANIQLTTRGLKVREYRAIDRSNWRYARVKNEECIHNLKFFVKGAPYKIAGVIPCSLHLFGTDSDYPVYLLGADNLGRDIFSRIVYGSRISLTIGFAATLISLLLAIILGGISGYFGSAVDWAIMRFAEFFMLIPSLYFILFLRSLLNTKMDSGTAYMIITLILALVGWPGSARTIRGLVHALKREEFVTDAQLEGLPAIVIIFRHIIPQTASLLIVSTALSVPGFIMSETTLSYLGLGISDPAVSWGSLINRDISTLSNLKNFPWLLYPVLMLLLVTLAFNFLGDALRDFFDPYSAVFKKHHKKGGSLPLSAAGTVSQSSTAPSSATPSAIWRLRHSLRRDSLKTCLTGFAPDGSLPTDNAHFGSALPLLSVQDLSVSFSIFRGSRAVTIQAVRGVSFHINKGEILGLVGESGSGKSVTTTAVPGLLPPNAEISGHIYFKGMDLLSLSQSQMRSYRGKKIALIFQEPGRSFDPLQNIGSVFFETYRILQPSITREESDRKAASILKEVGIPDPLGRLKSYPHQFSGGQLQRIGIALALTQDPELLIADEPTTALDVTIQAQIVSLLLKLKKERNLSIIFISHNINLVAEISDRICVMYGGKIMEEGSSEKIIKNPSHPYTKALLASIPTFGMHYTKGKMPTIHGKDIIRTL